MDFQLRFEKTLALLREKVGTVFNEQNSVEFEEHIQKYSELDSKLIANRIGLLFALLSNIYNLNADRIETNTEGISDVLAMKEYKFSIVNELAQLCPILISREVGKVVKIENQDQFNLFSEILEQVDQHITEKKLNDSQSGALLLQILSKHLFEIDLG